MESTDVKPLNDVQLMLLRLFSRPMSQDDLEAVRKLLMEYYDGLLQKEVEIAIEKKGISREDFDEVLNKQQRTK